MRSQRSASARREAANGMAVEARPSAIAASVQNGSAPPGFGLSASSSESNVSKHSSKPVISSSLRGVSGRQANASWALPSTRLRNPTSTPRPIESMYVSCERSITYWA
jgi:hypothetical protein